MAFDGFFCSAVAAELNGFAGARVEKIHQSSQTCFFFQIYRNGRHSNLVISASASRPVLAVTDENVAHPDTPTQTCMLYRKHLQNACIVSVDWIENERIVRFVFESADEMGYIKKKHIYTEMMGKYSNVILTSEDDRIISAASLSDITRSVRQIMVGLKYELPPKQDKISAFGISRERFSELCAEKEGMRISDFLLRTFLSFSPLTARELAFRTTGDCESLLTNSNAPLLYNFFSDFVNSVSQGISKPVAVFGADGGGVEYSFTPLTQYCAPNVTKEYASLSALLDDYFGRREEAVNIGRYSRELTHTLNTFLARARKKLVLLKNELADCAEMERFRIYGDVITANIYKMNQGDETLVALDYESGEEITVRLEKNLAPAKNAQKYYKKYAKLKRASVSLAEQIKKTESECDYLESVLSFIDRAASPAELAEIRSELAEGGYIHGSDSKTKKRSPASKPLSFTTTDGLTVRVGRNNKQNDALTGSAARNDIWFHIKGFHGSHVILTPDGDSEPSDRDYTESAMLAAYYSEKRGSDNVGVDYTRVRCLKKPNGSAPGFVTYEKYFTAYVDAKDPFAKENKTR